MSESTSTLDTKLKQLAALASQDATLASETDNLRFWQNLAASHSDTFNFFNSYCSRTGRVIATLTPDAQAQLLQVAKLTVGDDSQDEILLYLQDACLLHMRPAPAWQRVSSESIQHLAELDPTGACVFLLSRCFGYESATFRTHDAPYILRRNEWIISTFNQLSTPAYQLHVKPLLTYLIRIEGNVGLKHLRKLDKWTANSALPEATQLVDHLHRELSIMNGNWKHTVRNPNPYHRYNYTGTDSMFRRAYLELETKSTRRELQEERERNRPTSTLGKMREALAGIGDDLFADIDASIPGTPAHAPAATRKPAQAVPPQPLTTPKVTITTRGVTTTVTPPKAEQAATHALGKAPKLVHAPRSKAQIARNLEQVKAMLARVQFKKD